MEGKSGSVIEIVSLWECKLPLEMRRLEKSVLSNVSVFSLPLVDLWDNSGILNTLNVN